MNRLPSILLYSFFAALMLPFLALAFLLAPGLSLYSVVARRNRLPRFVQWFSTVDDSLDGGQQQHPDKYPAGVTGFRLWWQRTCWIWRNPAQGFQVYAFGYDMTYSYLEQETIAGNITTKTYMLPSGRRIFSYQRNVPLLAGYYVKLWFGWAKKTSILRYSLKFVPFSIASK